MSDIADFVLEQVLNAEYDRFKYRMGQMSDQRAYDLGIIVEYGGYDHPSMFSPPVRSKKCRYCGKAGLQWKSTETGWRLVEKDGTVHCCEQYYSY